MNSKHNDTSPAKRAGTCWVPIRVCVVVALLCSVSAPASEESGWSALHSLESALAKGEQAYETLAKQEFALVALTKEQATAARAILWKHRVMQLTRERADEVKNGVLKLENHEMPFFLTTFGERPKEGWSLWISMHGGGGGAKEMNDQQWENQKRLYTLQEGIYVAPRAPSNTWNLWHEAHIDPLFERLIEDLIALKQVDPDRVYIMGYSAGGDGVYQLAPRMADHWAAAAMMAGHPNDASWLGLRNVGFAIQAGGQDAAYNRNTIAQQWIAKLDDLHRADPQGYIHFGKIFENKGHWMDREDAKVLPWMAALRRNPVPERIVWKQSSVTHDRFYWLANAAPVPGAEVVAERAGQVIEIKSAGQISALSIRMDDRMLDLDQPVRVVYQGRNLFEGRAPRTIGVLIRTLEKRGDPKLMFDAEVSVKLPALK